MPVSIEEMKGSGRGELHVEAIQIRKATPKHEPRPTPPNPRGPEHHPEPTSHTSHLVPHKYLSYSFAKHALRIYLVMHYYSSLTHKMPNYAYVSRQHP